MISIIDAHVHVGRFGKRYFDPEEIGRFLLRQGVAGCVASATVAAVGKHDEAVRDLECLMAVADLTVWPLLWVTPGLLARHPDLAGPLRRLPYRGLKIHPRANPWSDVMLKRAFRIAEERDIGILLHTDDDFPAEQYRGLLLGHPNAKAVLAHGRPIGQAMAVLRDCPNAFVDTAFMPIALVRMLVKQGFGTRILYGSDTPIDCCYFSGPSARRYHRRLHAIQNALKPADIAQVMGGTCADIWDKPHEMRSNQPLSNAMMFPGVSGGRFGRVFSAMRQMPRHGAEKRNKGKIKEAV